MNPTDKAMLDYLESCAKPGLRWTARSSRTGRGYRLHQHDGMGSATARDAIREAMLRGMK